MYTEVKTYVSCLFRSCYNTASACKLSVSDCKRRKADPGAGLPLPYRCNQITPCKAQSLMAGLNAARLSRAGLCLTTAIMSATANSINPSLVASRFSAHDVMALNNRHLYLFQLLDLILMLVLPACCFSILLGCCPPVSPHGVCQLPNTLLLCRQTLLDMTELLQLNLHLLLRAAAV